MKAFSVLAALLLLFPSICLAQDKIVSLKEAIQLSLSRNNLLKASEQQEVAAWHAVSASRSRYYPRIFLDENFSASNAPTRVFMMKLDQGRFTGNDFQIDRLNHPAATGDFRTTFSLEQPIFDLGLLLGTDLLIKDSEGQNLALQQRREDVAFAVYSAYLEGQKARAMLVAAEQAVRDAEEHRRLARVRSETGVGLKSDELRAGTFLAEIEQQQITARNNVVLAGMRLGLVTGAPAEENLEISESLSGRTLGGEKENFVALALANRKDLQELAKAAEKAQVGVKLAGSAFLPTLHGTAGYQMNDRDLPFGRDNDSWVAGVNLRWELFDGFRRCDERARARSLENSARETLAYQQREVAFQVRESLLRLDEAEKRRSVARSALADAEESARLVSKRFANSLATLVDVFDAQTAVNRARAAAVETDAGYALATALVWYRAGIFLQEVMK
ncbi:MAG: TolC family protein [Deltaproteobacteria bacterium]|nr:TolC family protein [Deltaproteobacteria bacterium]TLN02398.1 MAG: TolC family protein [bacterium]